MGILTPGSCRGANGKPPHNQKQLGMPNVSVCQGQEQLIPALRADKSTGGASGFGLMCFGDVCWRCFVLRMIRQVCSVQICADGRLVFSWGYPLFAGKGNQKENHHS